jgi:hypothetical protein
VGSREILKPHAGHVALVSAAPVGAERAHAAEARHVHTASGFSLLLISLLARLLMAGAAACLLWAAVLWALG